jgi:hypothetical protein
MSRPGAALDFAIIGAQRAGSSHLSRLIAGHPDLYVVPDEVPYFEDPFFEVSSPSELTKALAPARPGQRRGIHRPELLSRPECAARLAAANPEVRVLAALRNPVDRAVSAHAWYVQFGLVPLEPVAVALRRLLDGWSDPRWPHAREVLDNGAYSPGLARYLELLGPKQVHVLRQEDLTIPEAAGAAFSFLGVDPRRGPEAFTPPTNQGIYHPRRLRWLRTRRHLAFSWDREDRYTYRPRRLRRPVRGAMAMAVVAVDRFVLHRVLGDPPADIPESLRADLTAHYAGEVCALEDLLRWDLRAWRKIRGGQE